MTDYDSVKDSGERQTWDTGSRRDTNIGKGRYDLIPPYFVQRLAKHLENGARKYGDRNWELGQPLSRYLDSALRHTFAVLDRQVDEDHPSAGVWNLMAFLTTAERIRNGELPGELDDLGYIDALNGAEDGGDEETGVIFFGPLGDDWQDLGFTTGDGFQLTPEAQPRVWQDFWREAIEGLTPKALQVVAPRVFAVDSDDVAEEVDPKREALQTALDRDQRSIHEEALARGADYVVVGPSPTMTVEPYSGPADHPRPHMVRALEWLGREHPEQAAVVREGVGIAFGDSAEPYDAVVGELPAPPPPIPSGFHNGDQVEAFGELTGLRYLLRRLDGAWESYGPSVRGSRYTKTKLTDEAVRDIIRGNTNTLLRNARLL